jgi:BASS family bile acid:Na+ symporter
VALTVFSVMFAIGLSVTPGELRQVWRSPAPMLRGLFAVLIVVPALALAVTRSLELPRAVEIGIVLMAISPGAPVALRRSLASGADAAFAPNLQMSVALLAVVWMPLSIAALDELYAGNASIEPADVLRQVFVAQLLPLGLGTALRQFAAPLAVRIYPVVHRAGTIFLLVAVALVVRQLWEPILAAGWRTIAAIVLLTCAALAAGHALGGPTPRMRTAVAMISAARNAGLALLVATQNAAAPAVTATILAYLAISVVAMTPYALWRLWLRPR